MKRISFVLAMLTLTVLTGCSDSTNVEPKAAKEDPRLKQMSSGGGATQEKGTEKAAITSP